MPDNDEEVQRQVEKVLVLFQPKVKEVVCLALKGVVMVLMYR